MCYSYIALCKFSKSSAEDANEVDNVTMSPSSSRRVLANFVLHKDFTTRDELRKDGVTDPGRSSIVTLSVFKLDKTIADDANKVDNI